MNLFIHEILLCIQENLHDKRERVYGILRRHLSDLNSQLAEEIPATLDDFLSQCINSSGQTSVKAIKAIVEFASIMQWLPFGERAINSEISLASCKKLLSIINKNELPFDWASNMRLLGRIYEVRQLGDQSENLELAIYYNEQALQMNSIREDIEFWASIQHSLGICYTYRLKGDKSENCRRAISYYEDCLKVYSMEKFPEKWAFIHWLLGTAYEYEPTESRKNDIDSAIKAYELALQVFTREAFPEKWARMHGLLARVYKNRLSGSRAQNLKAAIDSYKLALQVFDAHNHSKDFIKISLGMSEAYKYCAYENIEGSNRASSTAFKDAIKVVFLTKYSDLEVIDRIEAYLKLVYSILECPCSQVIQTLCERTELLDDNLLLVIGECVEASRCYEGLGEFLERFSEVEEKLSISLSFSRSLFSEIEPSVNSFMSQERCNIFFLDILVQIKESQNPSFPFPIIPPNNLNPGVVIEQQADSFNEGLLSNFYKIAARFVTRNSLCNLHSMEGYIRVTEIAGKSSEESRKSLISMFGPLVCFPIADIFVNLANIICQIPVGDRRVNVEIGIELYKASEMLYVAFSHLVGRMFNSPESVANVWMNLAIAYSIRLEGSNADNIEESISLYKQALNICPRNKFSGRWAQIQQNLANAYGMRIHGGRAENIELGIEACERATEVFRKGSEQWAFCQESLQNLYSIRLIGTPEENVEKSIQFAHAALKVFTFERFPERWARVHLNKANALMNKDKKKYSSDFSDSTLEAINSIEKSLTVFSKESFQFDWANAQYNLAMAYSSLGESELEKAALCLRNAMQVYTFEDFPDTWAISRSALGDIYYRMHHYNRKDDTLKQASGFYSSSLQVLKPESFPAQCQHVASKLGHLYFESQCWAEAKKSYQIAFEASEILYRSSLLLPAKFAELFAISKFTSEAAFSLAQEGDFQAAFILLERYRARMLGEVLERNRYAFSRLEVNHSELYSKYKDISSQIQNLEGRQREQMISISYEKLSYEKMRDTLADLRSQLELLLLEIDQASEFDNSIFNFSIFGSVREGGYSDHPLVFLVSTSIGGLALIVTPTTTDHLWINNFTEPQIADLINETWIATYNQFRQNRQAWYDVVDQVSCHLWDLIMGPLIQKLQDLNFAQATIIPKGLLSLLPLHAAWTQDLSKPTGRRYALDDIHFTYAPSAKSLTAAQAIAQHPKVETLLAIDNPRENLPNSSHEVAAAVATFPQSNILQNQQATTAAVKAHLPMATIAHFSCHGTANLDEPLTSGLAMSDGLLTLKDIFALNLAESGGLRLAILSACETGVQGIENADEAIGLPTGLLQAGVAAVIASLWFVDDLSTRILLTRFYDLWRKDHLEPSEALRQGQLWMRDTSSQQKAKYFQETNPDLFQSLILLPPDFFAHPFHWAAFSYTGV